MYRGYEKSDSNWGWILVMVLLGIALFLAYFWVFAFVWNHSFVSLWPHVFPALTYMQSLWLNLMLGFLSLFIRVKLDLKMKV